MSGLHLGFGPERNDSWVTEPLLSLSFGVASLAAAFVNLLIANRPHGVVNLLLVALFTANGIRDCWQGVRRYLGRPPKEVSRRVHPVWGVIFGASLGSFTVILILFLVTVNEPDTVFALPAFLTFVWAAGVCVYTGLRYGRHRPPTP